MRAATPSIRRARRRRRSRVDSSAQWRSSSTRTVGFRRSSSKSGAITSCGRAPPSTRLASSPPEAAATSANGPSGRGAKSASQAPWSTRISRGSPDTNAWTSAVLPPPASAATSTRRPCPCLASTTASRRASSCASRSRSADVATALKLGETEPTRLGGRLAPRTHVELPQDRGNVVVDSSLGEEEAIGDLGIAQTLGDEQEDLELAWSKARWVRTRGPSGPTRKRTDAVLAQAAGGERSRRRRTEILELTQGAPK